MCTQNSVSCSLKFVHLRKYFKELLLYRYLRTNHVAMYVSTYVPSQQQFNFDFGLYNYLHMHVPCNTSYTTTRALVSSYIM